ncbi:MAG: hypothetical protein ACRDGJ_09960 [Candidatus Limnocylindria bacterium]
MAQVYAGDALPPPDGPIRGPVPVVSPDQHTFPSALEPLTAYRWFIEYGGRFGTGWENSVTIATRGESAPFQLVLCAGRIRAPALFLIARRDEMPGADERIARLALRRIPGEKEIVDLDGGHFGLLHHPSALFDLASAAERDFLVRRLTRPS